MSKETDFRVVLADLLYGKFGSHQQRSEDFLETSREITKQLKALGFSTVYKEPPPPPPSGPLVLSLEWGEYQRYPISDNSAVLGYNRVMCNYIRSGSIEFCFLAEFVHFCNEAHSLGDFDLVGLYSEGDLAILEIHTSDQSIIDHFRTNWGESDSAWPFPTDPENARRGYGVRVVIPRPYELY